MCSHKQGRDSVKVGSVDVGAELIYQASKHIQSAILGSDKHGRDSIELGLVDISAGLLYQASEHVSWPFCAARYAGVAPFRDA
jgi:hypothetical protein